MYLNANWRAALAVTGIDGIPDVSKAGNVLRKSTTARVSVRLPPGVDADVAMKKFEEIMTTDTPYGAKVTCEDPMAGNGWSADQLAPWLQDVCDQSSEDFFGAGQKCRSYGVGGSIPFLYTLGEKFPNTQILAMGVLGAETNAHNPNECLDLPFAKTFIKSLSHVIAGCGAH